MTPEDQARRNIDSLLQQSGWIVQDRSAISLSAGRGVSIGEVSLGKGHGETDDLLFRDAEAKAQKIFQGKFSSLLASLNHSIAA